jgi:hypothetical protein
LTHDRTQLLQIAFVLGADYLCEDRLDHLSEAARDEYPLIVTDGRRASAGSVRLLPDVAEPPPIVRLQPDFARLPNEDTTYDEITAW